MPPEAPRSGSGPPTRLGAIDFAAQSCELCQRACAVAIAKVSSEATAASTSPLLDALTSCRRLMRINVDLLRERSPLHQLMSAACVAAAVLVCRACDLIRRSQAERGEEDPSLHEVADSCWVAAHACRDVVSAGKQSARAA
jgi:hypothetical protein